MTLFGDFFSVKKLQDLDGYCGVLNPPVRSRVWQQDVQMKFTWIYKPDSLHEQFKGNIGKPKEYLDVYIYT